MSFLDQEALEDMEVIPYLFQDDNNTGNPFLSALLQNDGEAIESVLAGLHVPSESEFERRLVRDTTGNHDSSESSASESSDSSSISTETEAVDIVDRGGQDGFVTRMLPSFGQNT